MLFPAQNHRRWGAMKTPVGMNIREPFQQILDMDFPVLHMLYRQDFRIIEKK